MPPGVTGAGEHSPAPRQSDGWDQALASVGGARDRLMRVRQVHGNAVRVLVRGRVPEGADHGLPDADAIVSNEPGLVLAVQMADCVPILIADPVTGSAAAVHAGWRGTCAGIAAAAIDAMVRECGVDPTNLMAAIGPSIGPLDYEVGETVVEAFQRAGHSSVRLDGWFRRTDGTLRLDLWTANSDQLQQSGLRAARIFACGLSTVPHPDVCASYRRDGDRAGRMAAVIRVPGA